MTDNEIIEYCFPIEEECGVSQIWEDLLKDLKPYPSGNDSDFIYWKKNGVTYFKQNKKLKTLWCHERLVWNLFEKKEKPDYFETQSLINNLMLSHDEWKDYDPGIAYF